MYKVDTALTFNSPEGVLMTSQSTYVTTCTNPIESMK